MITDSLCFKSVEEGWEYSLLVQFFSGMLMVILDFSPVPQSQGLSQPVNLLCGRVRIKGIGPRETTFLSFISHGHSVDKLAGW